MNKKYDIEIESLNADDLNVDQLERRLELASVAPGDVLDVWRCTGYTKEGDVDIEKA